MVVVLVVLVPPQYEVVIVVVSLDFSGGFFQWATATVQVLRWPASTRSIYFEGQLARPFVVAWCSSCPGPYLSSTTELSQKQENTRSVTIEAQL